MAKKTINATICSYINFESIFLKLFFTENCTFGKLTQNLLMKLFSIFCFLFLSPLLFFGQESAEVNLPDSETRPFSDAIATNIKRYRLNSNLAYETEDLERAQFLYDSLVNKVLVGTKFDNFLVNDYKSKQPIHFEEFTKPVYLKTTALWAEPNDSELKALNDVAAEFGDIIDFVVLYWESPERIREARKEFDDNITVLYVDELDNANTAVVPILKHSLGLPSIILMDEEKKILNIKKGVSPTFIASPLTEEVPAFGEFNTPDTEEQFVHSYGVYFDFLTKNVTEIINKM